MVEVESDLDYPITSVRHFIIAQPVKTDLAQEEYVLFGVFISANMIYPHDQSVEFEVSVG